MVQQMNRAKENNMAISKKDLDNIIYNLKIYKQLDDKVNQLSDDLIDAGKEPEKIYKNFTSSQDDSILTSMEESIRKIQELSKEIEDIQSGAKAKKDKIDNDARVKNLYQGKGYGPNEGIFRALTRQFLRDEIEAGTISVRPSIYDAMKEGNHPFIDPIKVFRYHYGDNKFDVLEKYIDENYPLFGSPGIRYPGRFDFRKLGLVPLNKNAPGNTYSHYSLPGEIDQQIADIDNVIKSIEKGIVPENKNAPGNTYEHYSLPGELDQEIADVDYVIKTIEEGKNNFYKTKEDIKNFNIKRANLVKIKNDIMPETTTELPGDELLESAEVIEFPKIDDTTDFARGGIVEVLI